MAIRGSKTARLANVRVFNQNINILVTNERRKYLESVKKTSKRLWNVNFVIKCINIDFSDGIL